MVEIDAMLVDENLHVELQDRRHPYVDVYEKEVFDDELRNARLSAIALISAFASAIASSLANPNATLQSVAVAFWARALALGLPCCEGSCVTALALSLGVTRATLSKAMVEFAAAHQLPPSRWMKSELSRVSYAEARIEHVKSNGNGQCRAHKPSQEVFPIPPRHRSV